MDSKESKAGQSDGTHYFLAVGVSQVGGTGGGMADLGGAAYGYLAPHSAPVRPALRGGGRGGRGGRGRGGAATQPSASQTAGDTLAQFKLHLMTLDAVGKKAGVDLCVSAGWMATNGEWLSQALAERDHPEDPFLVLPQVVGIPIIPQGATSLKALVLTTERLDHDAASFQLKPAQYIKSLISSSVNQYMGSRDTRLIRVVALLAKLSRDLDARIPATIKSTQWLTDPKLKDRRPNPDQIVQQLFNEQKLTSATKALLLFTVAEDAMAQSLGAHVGGLQTTRTSLWMVNHAVAAKRKVKGKKTDSNIPAFFAFGFDPHAPKGVFDPPPKPTPYPNPSNPAPPNPAPSSGPIGQPSIAAAAAPPADVEMGPIAVSPQAAASAPVAANSDVEMAPAAAASDSGSNSGRGSRARGAGHSAASAVSRQLAPPAPVAAAAAASSADVEMAPAAAALDSGRGGRGGALWASVVGRSAGRARGGGRGRGGGKLRRLDGNAAAAAAFGAAPEKVSDRNSELAEKKQMELATWVSMPPESFSEDSLEITLRDHKTHLQSTLRVGKFLEYTLGRLKHVSELAALLAVVQQTDVPWHDDTYPLPQPLVADFNRAINLAPPTPANPTPTKSAPLTPPSHAMAMDIDGGGALVEGKQMGAMAESGWGRLAAAFGLGPHILSRFLPESLCQMPEAVSCLLETSSELFAFVARDIFSYAFHVAGTNPRMNEVVAAYLARTPMPPIPWACRTPQHDSDCFGLLNELEAKRQSSQSVYRVITGHALPCERAPVKRIDVQPVRGPIRKLVSHQTSSKPEDFLLTQAKHLLASLKFDDQKGGETKELVVAAQALRRGLSEHHRLLWGHFPAAVDGGQILGMQLLAAVNAVPHFVQKRKVVQQISSAARAEGRAKKQLRYWTSRLSSAKNDAKGPKAASDNKEADKKEGGGKKEESDKKDRGGKSKKEGVVKKEGGGKKEVTRKRPRLTDGGEAARRETVKGAARAWRQRKFKGSPGFGTTDAVVIQHLQESCVAQHAAAAKILAHMRRELHHEEKRPREINRRPPCAWCGADRNRSQKDGKRKEVVGGQTGAAGAAPMDVDHMPDAKGQGVAAGGQKLSVVVKRGGAREGFLRQLCRGCAAVGRKVAAAHPSVPVPLPSVAAIHGWLKPEDALPIWTRSEAAKNMFRPWMRPDLFNTPRGYVNPERIDIWRRDNFFTADGKGGEKLLEEYNRTIRGQQMDVSGDSANYPVAARDRGPCGGCFECKKPEGQRSCITHWYPAYLSIHDTSYAGKKEKVLVIFFPGYALPPHLQVHEFHLLRMLNQNDPKLINDCNVRVFRWSNLAAIAGQVGRIVRPIAPSPVAAPARAH